MEPQTQKRSIAQYCSYAQMFAPGGPNVGHAAWTPRAATRREEESE